MIARHAPLCLAKIQATLSNACCDSKRIQGGGDGDGNAIDTADRDRPRCQGKAIVLFDDMATAKQRGANGVTLFWVTSEFPVDAAGAVDRAQTPVGVPPPANGTVFRVVDFAPAGPHAAPVDHIEILRAMGIDPATQGYARHANTHRTKTIDYAIVVDGEIDMLLDDSEIHVKAGDVLVQQATNHAWVNNSTKPCRIAFILIDAKTPAAWQQNWKP
jgi:mannose-6-phosphate isomerase-like protein (cupin superfamily)